MCIPEIAKQCIRPDSKPEELVEAAMTEMVYEKVPNKPVDADANEQLMMEEKSTT